MKKAYMIIAALFVVMAATMAFAVVKPGLPVDGLGIRVQTFAPDGTKSAKLTDAKTTVDMRDNLAYEIYTPTACIQRHMSTATITGDAYTLPANARITRAVSAATPFSSFSGCTNGELLRQ